MEPFAKAIKEALAESFRQSACGKRAARRLLQKILLALRKNGAGKIAENKNGPAEFGAQIPFCVNRNGNLFGGKEEETHGEYYADQSGNERR